MDLKTRKYIKNTNQLPEFDAAVENYNPNKKLTGYEAFKSRWNNGGGQKMTEGLIDTVNTAFQFNSMKTPSNYANDFVGKYGMQEGQVQGVNYMQYRDIDQKAEESKFSAERDSKIMQGASLGATTGLSLGLGTAALTGAGLGSWLGPVGAFAGLGLGALFGGIFGNDSKHEQERQMRIAQIKQNNANEFWRSGALSAALRNRELEDIGNTNRFSLFSSALGSENVNVKNGKTTKKVLAHTSRGVENVNANSKLNDGEIVRNRYKGTEHYVQGDPNQIDGEYGKLEKGDDVVSSTLTIPGTNVTIAQAYPIAKAQGWENELIDVIQPMSREMVKNNKTNGNLPHAWGGLENILATVPGMIQSWSDYNSISNDDIHRTQLNPFHKYEGAISDLMRGRSVSAYPQMQAITNTEAAQRYRINQSGGLTAMQKTMSNLANSMNSKIARANALANTQQIKNQYDKETADMLNNMGSTVMDATTRAQMFNEQMNASAHAAKTQGLNMAKRNMLDYTTQFAKNAWEKSQFDQMMDLYWQQVKQDALAEYNRNKKDTPATSVKQIAKTIDNSGLYGIRNTADTVQQRSDLYKKYMVNPFSIGKINSMKIPQKSAQQLLYEQRSIFPGWQPEDTNLLNMFMPSQQLNVSTNGKKKYNKRRKI